MAKFHLTLENCSYRFDDEQYSIEEELESGNYDITITADKGYLVQNLEIEDSSGPDPSTETYSTADGGKTIKANVYLDYGGTWGSCFATKDSNAKKTVEFVLTLGNCTSDFNETEIEVGEHTITFTANDGFEFDEKGIRMWGFNSVEVDDSVEFFPTDKKEFSYTFEVIYNTGIILKANEIPEQSLSSFTRVYETNENELGQMSIQRFIEYEQGNEIDLGSMILALYKIPFSIPNTLVARKEHIRLGNRLTTVESTLLNSYLLKISLGEITVPKKYNNLYDYKNTDVKLFIPYTKEIDLEVNDVINKTVTIDYVVNLYNSETTRIVKSDNKIIFNDMVEIGTKVPFIQLSRNNSYNGIKTILDNGIRQSYIEIKRNKPIVSTFGQSTFKQSKIVNESGYLEIGNIKLKDIDSLQEENEIKQLLRNGVFFSG